MTTETKILGGIGIASVLLVLGAVFFLSQEPKPEIVNTALLVKEDSNKQSSESAKLTIVEFGDYQCPACAAAHAPLKQAISEYPGQVSFVFRHFPLTQHKNAEVAAQAVEAAKLQGKLWEMHDKLYVSQNEWAEEANPQEIFKRYASELGLEVEKFATDLNSDSVKQKVRSDLTDGLALNINSTPTFYFNEAKYTGGISYQDFKNEIEERVN